jgi:hemerythrin-like domain-containing protein
VQQEWKHLGSGNAIAIQQAQSTNSLRIRNEEDIKEVLRYSMLLVGLRGNNLPTEEEKFVLTNFVRSNFGNQTPEEIKIAFEMAVAGKLNIDSKCYENFSCEYFGRIMNAYLEYARQEIKNLPKPIQQVKEKPSDQELMKQAIDTANEYANQIRHCEKNDKKFTFIAGGLSVLFDYLEQFKIPTISKEERLELWEKYSTIQDIEERKLYCKTQGYIKFVNSLVTFDCYIDNDGTIKPNNL